LFLSHFLPKGTPGGKFEDVYCTCVQMTTNHSLNYFLNLYRYTETCKNYSVTIIFYYILHLKLVFKKNYPEVNSCPILIKFVSTRTRMYVVFSSYFKTFFEVQILNIHNFKIICLQKYYHCIVFLTLKI
jgi:hypothetical protein